MLMQPSDDLTKGVGEERYALSVRIWSVPAALADAETHAVLAETEPAVWDWDNPPDDEQPADGAQEPLRDSDPRGAVPAEPGSGEASAPSAARPQPSQPTAQPMGQGMAPPHMAPQPMTMGEPVSHHDQTAPQRRLPSGRDAHRADGAACERGDAIAARRLLDPR